MNSHLHFSWFYMALVFFYQCCWSLSASVSRFYTFLTNVKCLKDANYDHSVLNYLKNTSFSFFQFSKWWFWRWEVTAHLQWNVIGWSNLGCFSIGRDCVKLHHGVIALSSCWSAFTLATLHAHLLTVWHSLLHVAGLSISQEEQRRSSHTATLSLHELSDDYWCFLGEETADDWRVSTRKYPFKFF